MSSVLITGSARGIGRATALELARRGHRVVATDRDVARLAGLPVDVRLELDVSTATRLRGRLVSPAGRLLISNAGVIFISPIETTPPEQLERLLRQNTVGAMRIAQALLPTMRERGNGRLLFISSVLGRMTLATRGAYAASKWALEALVETLAIEIAPFGVQVALLEPGSVASGALDAPLRSLARTASMNRSTPKSQVHGAARSASPKPPRRSLTPSKLPIYRCGFRSARLLAGLSALGARAADDAPFLLAPIAW